MQTPNHLSQPKPGSRFYGHLNGLVFKGPAEIGMQSTLQPLTIPPFDRRDGGSGPLLVKKGWSHDGEKRE